MTNIVKVSVYTAPADKDNQKKKIGGIYYFLFAGRVQTLHILHEILDHR